MQVPQGHPKAKVFSKNHSPSASESSLFSGAQQGSPQHRHLPLPGCAPGKSQQDPYPRDMPSVVGPTHPDDTNTYPQEAKPPAVHPQTALGVTALRRYPDENMESAHRLLGPLWESSQSISLITVR